MRNHRFHLNVTERCNIRCVHCYWQENGENCDPSLETIDTILHRFKALGKTYGEHGRHVLTIGGGEPTVRDDLNEIIRLAVRRGFRVRLVTNGVAIDENKAKSLRKAGLRFAQVSIDGATEATHDKVRGKGNWTRSMLGIEALKKAGIFVVLSYVVLPEINMEEAPLLLNLVRELRVAGAKFARPVLDGRAVFNHISVQGEYWNTFLRILDHAHQIKFKRLLMFIDPLAHLIPIAELKHTRGLWGLITNLCQCDDTKLIEVNGCTGDIYYCRIRQIIGNIWNDDLAKLWRSHPILVGLKRKTPEGACKNCEVWKECRGGCPAVVHGITGQTMLQDPDCSRVQEQGCAIQAFSLGLFSNPRPIGLAKIFRLLLQRLRDTVYSFILR